MSEHGAGLVPREWRPTDGDSRCQECGKPNPVWHAPNELWNAVVGTPDNPCGEGLILCPTCFTRRTARCGVTASEHVIDDQLQRPDGAS